MFRDVLLAIVGGLAVGFAGLIVVKIILWSCGWEVDD